MSHGTSTRRAAVASMLRDRHSKTRHTDTRHITAHHKAARQASSRCVQSAAPLPACCLDRLVAGPITPSTTAGHHVGRLINRVFSSSGIKRPHAKVLPHGCSCQPYAVHATREQTPLKKAGQHAFLMRMLPAHPGALQGGHTKQAGPSHMHASLTAPCNNACAQHTHPTTARGQQSQPAGVLSPFCSSRTPAGRLVTGQP